MPRKLPAQKTERTPSQKGKHARNKGASFEREVATQLRAVYPQAKRGLGQSRSAHEVPDVAGIPWWVEAKAHKRANIRRAFEQAVAASRASAGATGTPLPVLVVSKDDGKPVLATMLFSDMLALLFDAETGGHA